MFKKCLVCFALVVVEPCAHAFGLHLGLEGMAQYALIHLGSND